MPGAETIIAPRWIYLKGDSKRQVTEFIQSHCFPPEFRRNASFSFASEPGSVSDGFGRANPSLTLRALRRRTPKKKPLSLTTIFYCLASTRGGAGASRRIDDRLATQFSHHALGFPLRLSSLIIAA